MSARKSVLVVDDSSLILEMVQAALEAEGYEVQTAQDLSSLEARRTTNPPDLVILDVQMPEAYGDELGEAMREVRDIHAPMLLFSSLSDDDLARRASNAGLAGWVSKKAGMRALVERVKAVLEAT
jgi:DNA-binding response OmpR family regulator